MEPYVRLSFFTLFQLQPPTTMDLLPYRKTSRETSIRTRFKSLTSIEQTKLRLFEEMCSDQLCQVQKRKGPSKKGSFQKKRILVCIGLSIGIKADTYEEIEAPVRAGISLERTDIIQERIHMELMQILMGR